MVSTLVAPSKLYLNAALPGSVFSWATNGLLTLLFFWPRVLRRRLFRYLLTAKFNFTAPAFCAGKSKKETPTMKVTITGRKANKANKTGKYIIDAVKEDGRHLLLGNLEVEPKQGEKYEVFGDTFKMEQDALWAEKATLIPA